VIVNQKIRIFTVLLQFPKRQMIKTDLQKCEIICKNAKRKRMKIISKKRKSLIINDLKNTIITGTQSAKL
jgi:hypothetical protein